MKKNNSINKSHGNLITITSEYHPDIEIVKIRSNCYKISTQDWNRILVDMLDYHIDFNEFRKHLLSNDLCFHFDNIPFFQSIERIQQSLEYFNGLKVMQKLME